ncbi:hypothetical protein NL676_016245 [Syzygium grande]|nr:hypothetical protein NL676_016245 [Syzygium grande]
MGQAEGEEECSGCDVDPNGGGRIYMQPDDSFLAAHAGGRTIVPVTESVAAGTEFQDGLILIFASFALSERLDIGQFTTYVAQNTNNRESQYRQSTRSWCLVRKTRVDGRGNQVISSTPAMLLPVMPAIAAAKRATDRAASTFALCNRSSSFFLSLYHLSRLAKGSQRLLGSMSETDTPLH